MNGPPGIAPETIRWILSGLMAIVIAALGWLHNRISKVGDAAETRAAELRKTAKDSVDILHSRINSVTTTMATKIDLQQAESRLERLIDRNETHQKERHSEIMERLK